MRIQQGDLAPDFILTDLDGNERTLGQYRGQSVLLIFLRHLG